jgi:ketosteroid isomerase-like protein
MVRLRFPELRKAKASTQTELQALLDSRVEACRAKDIDRLMSLYSPNIVYFDCVPPLHFTGSDAVRRNFLRWFNEYEGEIGLETRDLNIAISGMSRLHICFTWTKETPTWRTGLSFGYVLPFAANGQIISG